MGPTITPDALVHGKNEEPSSEQNVFVGDWAKREALIETIQPQELF